MFKREFEFSISPLIGARKPVIEYFKKNHRVHPQYKHRWTNSMPLARLLRCLSAVDKMSYNYRKEAVSDISAPIFILGHWRSGTTLLHNLLCLDSRAAYTTTYHSVFPNNLFGSQRLIKPFMKMRLPKTRPADGMRMDVALPQEEELALGFEVPYSFYYWILFPADRKRILDEFLLGNTSEELRRLWMENYRSFVCKAILNSPGHIFISKNPAHTARIPMLLELFPDARFIYMHRNPYQVYRSTLRFFKHTVPAIQLQPITDIDFQEHTLATYSGMLEAFERDRIMIPTQNLLEVRFDDLVKDPTHQIERIYSELGLEGYENVSAKLQARVAFLNNHTPRTNPPTIQEVELVNRHWGNAFELYGYPIQGTPAMEA